MSKIVPDDSARLNEIGQLLGKAARERLKREGHLMQPNDEEQIQEALKVVMRICDGFREAIFEQVHSVRVKQMTEDFDALVERLNPLKGRALTDDDQNRVRERIKAWHRESRRWVAELPLQKAVTRLPDRDGHTSSVRLERLKACWLEAGAASFAPPPPCPGALPQGVPDHFQLAPLGLSSDWCMDPMDAVRLETGRPKWECRPDVLLEVLDWAYELLLLEVGGADCGGRTTFAQRRRQASLKDTLAFSCIIVFERVVGHKSARQSKSGRRDLDGTFFEQFVAKIYAMAIGDEGPRDWTMGPDPIRKAIATQRAWQKFFKAEGVSDFKAFNHLPSEERFRLAAKAELEPKGQGRLRPSAMPWV